MWVNSHAPERLSDLVGNSGTVSRISSWLSKWKPGGKAALLYGLTGSGKTTAAYLLAAENEFSVVEMNASDLRNRKEVERVLGGAGRQRNLFDGGKLLLVDEVDGMGGRGKGGDYGGVGAVVEVIKTSQYPVILTANRVVISGESGQFNPAKWEGRFSGKKENKFQIFSFLKEVYQRETGEKPNEKMLWAITYSSFSRVQKEGISSALKALPIGKGANWWEWNPKLSPLRNYCELFEFRAPELSEVAGLVEKIAKSERVSLGPGVAEEIAGRTGCDVRSAITALETVSRGRARIGIAELDGFLDARDRRSSVEEAVRIILATSDPGTARHAFRSVDGTTPEEFSEYVRENVAVKYSGASLGRAYSALSDADRVAGRIVRTGSQSLLPYRIDFLTGGVAASKPGKCPVAGKIISPLSRYSAASVKARRMRRQIAGKIKKAFPLAKARSALRLVAIDRRLWESVGLDKDEEDFLKKWMKK
ncbi:MAG: AAA family ATPase [archaeon]